ncbi:hypothetical protein FBU30_002039 [Linnemannia zychae]|nr:hypothetical protein FBU30_002039 [Linnemannia zychae]
MSSGKDVSGSIEELSVQVSPESNTNTNNASLASAATPGLATIGHKEKGKNKDDSDVVDSTNSTIDTKENQHDIDDNQDTASDNNSMPTTDITHSIYPPQSETQAYSPPSPVSTNPFRRSPSVSPSLSASHSLSSRLPPLLADEDPFSLSAAATTLSPVAAPSTATSTVTPSSPAASNEPPELPPPPAYTQTELTVLDDRASGYSGMATSDAISVATLSPVPSVSTAAPSGAVPVNLAPTATATMASGSSLSRTSPSREPESVNQYVLKPIDWIDPSTGVERRIKIITQNENGPCPLLALCNTLILQGKVSIRPYDRPTIGYDHLLELLADYLLNEEPADSGAAKRVGEHVEAEKVKSRLEIESALRLLPHLEHGLDVNVFFKSIRGFEPTAELGLFHTFGVELVHGWVVSPVIDTDMYALVDGPAGISSYNKAVECIVNGDSAGNGLVVEDVSGNITPISPSNQTSSERSRTTTSGSDTVSKNEKIRQALVVQEFMNATKTQLTHYGLHVLQESLPEGHLCAFFRNNHFCTLFKSPMDGTLYTLVTDQSLAHELSIVWESLVDIDGAGDFLDGLFRHGALEVGDYARNNQPLDSHGSGHGDGGGDEDFALALQLQQQEEEEEARRIQKSKSRISQHSANNNNNSSSSNRLSQHGNYHQGQVSNPSHGGAYLSLQSQTYETDEQMAARLHQEYLADSQQQLQRQQQQQNPYPYLSQNMADPYANYGSNGVPQHLYSQSSQTQYQSPQQQQQQQGYQPQWQSQQQHRPQLQQQQQTPQVHQSSVSGQGHTRQRVPSDSSSRKSKEKCIIQ